MARALDEPIAPKKANERLSRNLATMGMDENLNATIAAEGASRIGKDTLSIVDPTDMRNEYAENSLWPVEVTIRFMKQSYNLEAIRLLDWHRLK